MSATATKNNSGFEFHAHCVKYNFNVNWEIQAAGSAFEISAGLFVLFELYFDNVYNKFVWCFVDLLKLFNIFFLGSVYKFFTFLLQMLGDDTRDWDKNEAKENISCEWKKNTCNAPAHKVHSNVFRSDRSVR